MVSTYPWTHGIRLCVPWILGILVAASAFAAQPAHAQQQSGYASESLFIALFLNGDALVEYDVSILNPVAEEVRIQLPAKRSVSNLIVVDYDDNVIPFTVGSPTEIVLNTPGVQNVRISYTTQDLVDRNEGRWIFTLNATTGFAVRLPPDSVLIDAEPLPAIKIVADQYLLTFDNPGDTSFMYVIGVLGTEEQANIVIRLAETTIDQISESHPGIVLAGAQDLLKQATEARDNSRFGDAETLAGKSNDAAVQAARDYEATQQAIADAEEQISAADGQNRDTAAARTLLQEAKAEFASGNYVAARNAAEDVAGSIRDTPAGPEMPISVIVAAAVAAAGGIGALVFLRMRKQAAPALQKREGPQDPPAASRAAPRSPVPEVRTKVEEPEEAEEMMSDSSPAMQAPSTLPDSQTDSGILSRIVGRIVEERPHLRPEDQDVLRFLAEKEGAAFESEIRTKFQLPKTTIWRLVKRLEREELVEIRKAGGQNLIKLKFEGLQA